MPKENNINPIEGHKLLERCPILKQYGQFVDLIRYYQDSDDNNAYKHAIENCIRQGILTDYLKRKGSEVINMLIAEYDYDLDIEVQREEAFEEGEISILKKQVLKKLAKGKSLPIIAEELEETPDTIRALIEKEHLLPS